MNAVAQARQQAQLRKKIEAARRKKRRGRYGNVRRAVIDGISFASTAEAARYSQLKLLLIAGTIADLELQPRFPIEIGGVPVMMRSNRYSNGRQLTYVADFKYFDLERRCTVIEDVKMHSGHLTEVYKIKRALVQAMGLTITEV